MAKITPVLLKHQKFEARKWFYGSADLQRAESERLDGEEAYPVEIEIEDRSGYLRGFAVGAPVVKKISK